MAWITGLIAGGATLLSGALSKPDGPSAESKSLMVKQGQLIDQQTRQGAELWDLNKRMYIPRERQLIDSAFNELESPEAAAARATSDIRLAQKNNSATSLRDARRLGIDPSSGAYLANDTSKQIAEIGLEASARGQARRTAKDHNFQRQYSAVGLGRGIASTAGAVTGQALNANANLINTNLGLDAANADFNARRGETIGEGIGMIGSGVADWYKSRKSPPPTTKAAA